MSHIAGLCFIRESFMEAHSQTKIQPEISICQEVTLIYITVVSHREYTHSQIVAHTEIGTHTHTHTEILARSYRQRHTDRGTHSCKHTSLRTEERAHMQCKYVHRQTRAHTRASPHAVHLPGTTKALLRQRMPCSSNELVAMPMVLATA